MTLLSFMTLTTGWRSILHDLMLARPVVLEELKGTDTQTEFRSIVQRPYWKNPHDLTTFLVVTWTTPQRGLGRLLSTPSPLIFSWRNSILLSCLICAPKFKKMNQTQRNRAFE